ncbi:pentatricopeptide repeat-containing protein [Corchorus olitorius]|uniref:Pentatricopeptide repeat-containing protein n=1 Tax=Corchorus olitorius TaxID=93759 RepID=A0A1R3K8C2_9ROSI|nr:pentatricopeptide repeat-containing protein [Corchorus olitorius]
MNVVLATGNSLGNDDQLMELVDPHIVNEGIAKQDLKAYAESALCLSLSLVTRLHVPCGTILLPVKPGVLVWQALLGACSIHGDSEMGKYAADQLLFETPESPVPYITMENIYSSGGKRKERATTIKRMEEMGLAKEIGISWIEIEKEVHKFVVQDGLHPQAEAIYEILEELFKLMLDEGYVPDQRFQDVRG